jgi:hypothetical protein
MPGECKQAGNRLACSPQDRDIRAWKGEEWGNLCGQGGGQGADRAVGAPWWVLFSMGHQD